MSVDHEKLAEFEANVIGCRARAALTDPDDLLILDHLLTIIQSDPAPYDGLIGKLITKLGGDPTEVSRYLATFKDDCEIDPKKVPKSPERVRVCRFMRRLRGVQQ